jgi:hypothetical protein
MHVRYDVGITIKADNGAHGIHLRCRLRAVVWVSPHSRGIL